MLNEMLMIWPDQPALSLAVWLAVLILVMYLGRTQSHQLLRSSGRSIYRLMRLCSRSLNSWQVSLANRNKTIIIASGQESVQRTIEREFTRVNEIVARDLGHYPTLHRQISDTVSKIEKDYQSITDTPPSPPAWLEVIETVSAIQSNGDPAVGKILDKIHDSITAAHDESMKAYQKNSHQSHKVLSQMQPLWRNVSNGIDDVKKNVDGLEERAGIIDQHMQNYEKIRAQDDDVVQALVTSSLTQFFIAGLVLFIAVMGGVINFQLIAMPMSEMVGGTSYIGAMKTSDIAALVIIMVEIAMGLFLLESLRITHLFPIIGSMDDKMRKRMMIITLSILTILASVEASLAYMRDLLALDRETLKQSLAGAGIVEANFRWIPSLGQMIMGFILPFALAFVAIPLESFIHSLRTVLGLIAQGVLRLLAVFARLFGNTANYLCKVLIHLYDLIIMVPLSIERLMTKSDSKDMQTNRDVIDTELTDLSTAEGAKS